MRRWVISMPVTTIALLSIGCGTFFNTVPVTKSERPQYSIYGGVQGDLGPCCNILDLPFSALGDTVTLPITIPYSIHRMITKSGKSPDDSTNLQHQLDVE